MSNLSSEPSVMDVLHGMLSCDMPAMSHCRYICVLWLGVRCCRFGHPRFTDAALHEQNDVSILRLFQVFLESAPQLVLQASIMWLAPDDLTYQQGMCCILIDLN